MTDRRMKLDFVRESFGNLLLSSRKINNKFAVFESK